MTRENERRAPRGLRLLVTVTLNDNQLRSHLLPILALDEVESVLLVADERPAPLPKLDVRVPPRWLTRAVGRAAAKLVLCAALAIRRRPDWVIGFNLVPHGLNAVTAAALARTRSLYEMIGGDREWVDGGWDSDNAILGKIPRPSRRIERLLLAVARRSTAVAVMGPAGRAALVSHGFAPGAVHIVTPAVDLERFSSADRPDPTYDVVTVGALLPNKRIADLLKASALLLPERPGLRVAIAGEGPLEPDLRRLVADLGLEGAVEFCGFRSDVETLYRATRAFVLCSAYEGLSVAMLEAMACGAVPVVTDVGELGDFVRDGETGKTWPPGDVDALAGALREVLGRSEHRETLAAAAAAEVRRRASVSAVAAVYRGLLEAPRRNR